LDSYPGSEFRGKISDHGLVLMSWIRVVREAILDAEVNEVDAQSAGNGESQGQQQIPLGEGVGLKRHHFEVATDVACATPRRLEIVTLLEGVGPLNLSPDDS